LARLIGVFCKHLLDGPKVVFSLVFASLDSVFFTVSVIDYGTF